ncbi:oligosaccharide flippase family protein [Candidatus Pacearchaeota archaeon]|nr:oligosaccharide flippase family protein [Candidatus Pacearchaeota archaeon]
MGRFTDTVRTYKEFFRRVTKRDYSGYDGLAIRNYSYQLSTNLVAKVGGLIYTIIIARMLMPELFGLYSLALSTIFIFMAFSDLGVGDTVLRFISRELGRKNYTKAKSYFNYLFRLKIYITLFATLLLLISARFISENYYHKPIFLALIAGCLYVIFTSFSSFLYSIAQSSNKFRGVFYKESIFQFSRLILIPTIIVLSVKTLVDPNKILFNIVIGLSFASFITVVFLALYLRKEIKYLTGEPGSLSAKEKDKVKKFILAISITSLCSIISLYTDVFILGRFVSPEFIGNYTASLSLIGAAVPLITFSVAIAPILNRLPRKKLEIFFRKILAVSLVLSLVGFVFVFVLSDYIIKIIFGEEYVYASGILRILCFLFFSMPLVQLYATYFIAIGKPFVITRLLVTFTAINIILNFAIVSYLAGYSEISATYGAAFATSISGAIYLILLFITTRFNHS